MNFWIIVSHVALAAAVVLSVLLITRADSEQRSPSATLAWLLLIIFIPYLGIPLYLLFGGRKMRKVLRTKAEIRQAPRISALPEDMYPLEKLFRNTDLPGVTVGNCMKLSHTGEEAFYDLVGLIRRAEKSIYITTFIYSRDAVGTRIMQELAARAREGVDVRINMDAMGSLYTRRRFFRPLIEAGGQVTYFLPVLPLPFRRYSHLRNHRKVVVVDNRWAMSGGMNIGSEYLGPTPEPHRWLDLAFVVEGPAARDFAEVFRADWEFAGGEKVEPPGEEPAPCKGTYPGAVVQVLPSGPDVPGDFLYETLLSLLFWADERVWIVTPYFVPNEALARAIHIAARRGVDVRLIMPEKSNHPVMDVARRQFLRDLQQAGGKVYYYLGGMMHAKAILVDNEVAVMGSANVDMRSLLLNFEVMVLAYSPSEIRATEQWIEGMDLKPRPMDEKVGRIQDFAEGLVRMIAPIL
ncbi:MAG: cardiolipin synthase [Desulfatibacillaceae bacterium]